MDAVDSMNETTVAAKSVASTNHAGPFLHLAGTGMVTDDAAVSESYLAETSTRHKITSMSQSQRPETQCLHGKASHRECSLNKSCRPFPAFSRYGD